MRGNNWGRLDKRTPKMCEEYWSGCVVVHHEPPGCSTVAEKSKWIPDLKRDMEAIDRSPIDPPPLPSLKK